MKLVSAAVVKRNEKVLIARRAPGEELAGCWEFPGGKVEDWESPQESLEREMMEELGIVAKAQNIVLESDFVYSHGSFRILAIETEIESENFKLSVHDQIEWVAIVSLLDYELLPADIPIAKELIKCQISSQTSNRVR